MTAPAAGATDGRGGPVFSGVTSISADLHELASAGEGASLLLRRSIAGPRHRIFVATESPGGICASPTLLGTRPGGPIAAAWAALQGRGEAGHLALLGRGDATIVADLYTGRAGPGAGERR